MTDSGDTASVPGSSSLSSGTGLSLTAGRGLPGRVRSVSSPTPPGRLTSLRTRDLTLGGVFKKSKVCLLYGTFLYTVYVWHTPKAWKHDIFLYDIKALIDWASKTVNFTLQLTNAYKK